MFLANIVPSLLLVMLLAACGGDRVAVHVAIPDEHGVETPLAGLRLTFLPFDRDSLLAALEAAATPRPSTEELDSLFQAFRGPFTGYLRASAELERARQALTGAPTPARADSVARLERAAEAARQTLARARTALQPAMDSLRQRMGAWEDTAFRTYDSLATALTRRRAAVVDSTRSNGWVTVTLPPGRWWVVARAFSVLDPYAGWYWNLPVAGDTLVLNRATGRQQPRYR